MRSTLITRRTSCLLGCLFLLLLVAVGVPTVGADPVPDPGRDATKGSSGAGGEPPATGQEDEQGSLTDATGLSEAEQRVLEQWLHQRTQDRRRFQPRLLPSPEQAARSTVCRTANDPRCAEARAIASMGACTRPEDCPAVDAWQDLMGSPAVELAVPVAARAQPLDAEAASVPTSEEQMRRVEDDPPN